MPSHQYKVTTVAEEYSKNPELKQEDIRNLQDWVAKEAHLPDIPEDQLILFLHSCYYSLEKAKKTIEASYTIRTHAPELFADRDPRRPELQAVWDILQVASLPQRDADGNKVIVVRLCDGDPSKFVHGDVARLFLMAMDTSLREDGTAPGYRFVYDMKGLAFGHLSRINLTILRKYMVYVQEGLRIRMKTIHNINMSPLGEKLIGLMRPLMKKEMVNQMHFHTCDLEPLYAFVPRKILPKDYGGDEASMEELSCKNTTSQALPQGSTLADDTAAVISQGKENYQSATNSPSKFIKPHFFMGQTIGPGTVINTYKSATVPFSLKTLQPFTDN